MRQALEYLQASPAFHMNIIDPLLHGDAELLAGDSNGVLIRERNSGAYMMSAANEAAARRMMDLAGRCDTFVCHQPEFAPIAQERFGLSVALDCVGAAYLADHPAEHRGLYEIRPLTLEHLRTVRSLYHNVDDEDYMRARIESGRMWGAFDGERLLGFAGIHAESSMGMLEVPEEHRRRHVASELQSWLINHILEQGRTPFCQIFPDNEPSVRLQESLGMTISCEHIAWICG